MALTYKPPPAEPMATPQSLRVSVPTDALTCIKVAQGSAATGQESQHARCNGFGSTALWA
eukprot:scaffold59566_cov31-Prasinocladus_malaysianus.AAC.2